MKRADRRHQGLGAIELIEQAIHELRAAPPATLASYYLGALPFVLGLLFFWADMSRSAFADQHLAGAALGVAALFLWMKFWQAVFARNLRASFAGEPPPPLGLRQCRRIFITQTALQPSGLFLLPLAFIAILPAAWVCAFYQSLTAFAAAEAGDVRSVLKKAARQAALWPRQNFTLLAILLGFGFYVLLNWITVCLILPQLAKTLLGVESVFARSPLSLLNTTFLAAALGLTYLTVDPIVKAVYALRCFYGESLESGEDLKVELRRLAMADRPMVAGLVAALLVFGAASAYGASASCRSHQAIGAQPLGCRNVESQWTSQLLRYTSREARARCSRRGSSVRSGMFIASVPRRDQAPLGAACLSHSNAPSHMPLLAELETSFAGGRFYKHGAPSGAVEHRSGCEISTPACRVLADEWHLKISLCRTPFPRCCSLKAALLCRRQVSASGGATHEISPEGDGATPPAAASPAAAVLPASVSPLELDRAIQEVIQQRKYAWRMPREKNRVSEAGQPGLIRRFFQRVGGFLRREIKAFFEWLGKWLRKLSRHPRPSGASGYGWIMFLEVLLYVLLAVVVAGLALLLVRLWRNWQRPPGAIASQPIQPAPDLTDESFGAEQLPEDRWTALARELLARGEMRLAVRAFYFASLASLAERNLISLAKFKSNRDYERELRRRGHSFPEMLALFSENVQVVDCIWYGLHQINAELVSRFAANVERIKTSA